MGAVVVKVSADGGFSLLDIAWIRRCASNDERAKAGNANLDALGHIFMFHGTDNKRHLENWILENGDAEKSCAGWRPGFS
jgi:hypothetical protein